MENQIRVLLVDDEQDFTELMVHALRALPYCIEAVNSGEAALQHIENNRVDILITDVRMPGMSGFDLMEKVHQINPDTHVIAISAHGKLDTAVEFMKKGAVDFLQKPVDNVDIQLAIESAAAKWRLRQELHMANRHLKRMNESLQHEIRERKHAEDRMLATNQQLEAALIELKQTQQQLIKQERMGALGQMSRGVAHDFNNALQPIMLAAGFMQANPKRLMEMGILEEYIDEIVQATEAAAATVRRLVRFYATSGQSELLTIDLNELIRSVVDITRPRWKNEAMASGKTIEMVMDLEEGCRVDGYRDELREVFVNLIFNAVEAIEQRGTISITAKPTGGRIVVSVRDDGCGMSEDIKQRCMEPFVTTRMQKGSGLGLSVVYGVVEQHKASIEIESEEGRGTMVTITFPAASGESPAPEKPYDSGSSASVDLEHSGPSHRILVVDDELSMRRMLSRVLKRLGHEVDAEESGKSGWERFQAKKYDLVITDQAMPEMTGDRLADLIKQHGTTPVIMVTGFGDLLRARDNPPANIDLLLSKPIQIEQLTKAIDSVMAGEKPD
ncbi:MAG: response regulator [Kiritimatiellae bacterium]|nr:response regulator [Kiritimatiellia bacterium]